mgnify:CR=1 FL=1
MRDFPQTSDANRAQGAAPTRTGSLLRYGLHPVVHLQALEDFLQVIFDREWADAHDGTHFVVGLTLAHPFHDFHLTCCQHLHLQRLIRQGLSRRVLPSAHATQSGLDGRGNPAHLLRLDLLQLCTQQRKADAVKT